MLIFLRLALRKVGFIAFVARATSVRKRAYVYVFYRKMSQMASDARWLAVIEEVNERLVKSHILG